MGRVFVCFVVVKNGIFLFVHLYVLLRCLCGKCTMCAEQFKIAAGKNCCKVSLMYMVDGASEKEIDYI